MMYQIKLYAMSGTGAVRAVLSFGQPTDNRKELESVLEAHCWAPLVEMRDKLKAIYRDCYVVEKILELLPEEEELARLRIVERCATALVHAMATDAKPSVVETLRGQLIAALARVRESV
jgi:hypothetical protein